MDPFRMCLALGPVAVYLLLLGGIHLARRPFVVSGTRDTAALGLAVAGLVAVGPVELFFPHAAAAHFGIFVWVFLTALYGLCLVLLLLVSRPRLVIYNVSAEELRPILADLVPQLDADARWAGDGLILPNLGVQLHLDNLPLLRNVALAATGARQSYAGWKRLETDLRTALAGAEASRNVRAAHFLGATLLGIGALLALVVIWAVAREPQTVARALFDMLRVKP
jgi:hypothetical protein